jgi:hypothetical protein
MEILRRPEAGSFSNVLSADQLARVRSLIPTPELDALVRYHPNLLIVGKESAVAPTPCYSWPKTAMKSISFDLAYMKFPMLESCKKQINSFDKSQIWRRCLVTTPNG